MKKRYILIFALCVICTACGKNGEPSSQGEPAPSPSPSIDHAKNAASSSDSISGSQSLELQNATVGQVLLKMSRFVKAGPSLENTAKALEKEFSIQCSPLCNIQRRSK